MICFGIAVLVLTAINYCESAPHGFLPYRRQDSTPSGFANDIAKGPTPPIIENAKLRYFSGPLLHQSVIHPIYWGGSAKVAFTSRDTSRNVFDFYSTIVHSRYFDWLSEYSAASNGYIIGRGSVLSPLEAQTASALTGAVNDSQIRSFLLDLAVSGEINPTENTYYPIHLPPDVTVTYNNRRSCRDFCGYHNTIGFINAATGQLTRLYYGVIPDQGGNCTTGCGSGSNPFNRFCVVASHLLIEAVTDPAVGLATAFSSPLGWYDEGNQMEVSSWPDPRSKQ
ncbi:hypothetical protein BJ742DRAFT_236272 [Cladochytrium replicatum]|nr:hypothetical protein BJ742DRAFT_236272 [Cladochytrium replicatum]